MAARALINVPPKAKRGEIIGIKSLISHEMETGFRPNASGQLIPRDIITEFVCTYNGGEVFRAEFFPAISNSIVFCRNARPELIASDPTCDPIGKTYQGYWRVRS
jgi:hypothetical protein